jgi:hypothetical protein
MAMKKQMNKVVVESVAAAFGLMEQVFFNLPWPLNSFRSSRMNSNTLRCSIMPSKGPITEPFRLQEIVERGTQLIRRSCAVEHDRH